MKSSPSTTSEVCTTVRVVARRHRRTADGWTPTQPPLAPGLTQFNTSLIDVTHLTDGCLALRQHFAYLARWQFYQGVSPFFCHKLGIGSSTSNYLAAFSQTKFDVMDLGAQRNIA